MNPSQPLRPGDALRSARESFGLAQSDIAARTRIPVGTIQAIEAEDWMALPAPVYTRGFLRVYANELGLDAEAIVGAWRAQVGDPGTPGRTQSARLNGAAHTTRLLSIRAVAGIAAMAVVVGVVFALFLGDNGSVGDDGPAVEERSESMGQGTD